MLAKNVLARTFLRWSATSEISEIYNVWGYVNRIML